MGIENVEGLKPEVPPLEEYWKRTLKELSGRRGAGTVRIPLVMYTSGKRRVLGTADVIYLNDDERAAFSNSELIADAFDVRHDVGGDSL